MNTEQLILIERHTMLRDAHAVLLQGLKYPGTVSADAIKAAQARIDACEVLAMVSRGRSVAEAVRVNT